MIEHLTDPVATAEVSWIPADEGGRRSGPPTAPVYAATCFFLEEDTSEITSSDRELFSVLLERDHRDDASARHYRVDFLAPSLVAPHLTVGAHMVVTEGPKPVARSIITAVAEQTLRNHVKKAGSTETHRGDAP